VITDKTTYAPALVPDGFAAGLDDTLELAAEEAVVIGFWFREENGEELDLIIPVYLSIPSAIALRDDLNNILEMNR
jgi:hypothetical protein